MKQLLGVLFVVILAVALTLFSQGNVAKVVVFFNDYRVDVSLNVALVILLCGFLLLHGVLLVIRYSGQVPGRLRDHFSAKRQAALRQANTEAFMAWVLGDSATAHNAWEAAQKTGVDNDLSHLLHALFAIQVQQWDTAEQTLNALAAVQAERKNRPVVEVNQSTLALQLLRARVALHQGDAQRALTLLQELTPTVQSFNQVLHTRLLALQAAQQWPAALACLRQCWSAHVIGPAEYAQACFTIYQGLVYPTQDQARQDAAAPAGVVADLVAQATAEELNQLPVVEVLCAALLRVGLLLPAQQLLERALNGSAASLALLPWYHAVAMSIPKAVMPFVETLLMKYPNDVPVQELAGDVFAQEQLWGKAIACYELVYEMQASGHVARKLERIFQACNQTDKVRLWAARTV